MKIRVESIRGLPDGTRDPDHSFTLELTTSTIEAHGTYEPWAQALTEAMVRLVQEIQVLGRQSARARH